MIDWISERVTNIKAIIIPNSIRNAVLVKSEDLSQYFEQRQST
ncbi:MAG: hypothetical protein ABGA11_07620 [Liquorilactobacillus hordei]